VSWPGAGLVVGSHTTLVQKLKAVLPKLGSAKRTELLPEPAAKSTFPLGSSTACTARSSESNGSTCQLPWSAGFVWTDVTVALIAVAVGRTTLDVEVWFETSVIAVITSRRRRQGRIRPSW
jgi:heme exporter protein D